MSGPISASGRSEASQVPTDLTVPVNAADHARGPVAAPITLVEYGDLQCPYCAMAHRRLVPLLAGGRVRLIFRHFALDEIHGRAEPAALAAEAASLQGRFWEMHDRLFEHQDRAGDNDLIAHARVLGLDLDDFRAALDDEGLLRRIRDDRSGGESSGVTGTPTFFVDGHRHDGPWAALLGDLTNAR